MGTHHELADVRGARCLFVCMTAFNTSVLQPVAAQLTECECWFTPVYSSDTFAFRASRRLGLLNWTTLNPRIQTRVVSFMEDAGLRVDHGATQSYDLIVLGNDFVVPQNLRRRQPKVLVQEGWVWPKGWRRWVARTMFLPPWIAGANGAGLSNDYDRFCVASEGHKRLFLEAGISEDKLVVTGMPTIDSVRDDFRELLDESQALGYVLVTTHPGREYFEGENRQGLLRQAREIAAGRPVIVKLHPHEDHERARREVERWLPDAKVSVHDDVRRLIANCDVLVTTYSTTIFYALALGKDVVSSYGPGAVDALVPMQNGDAAARIANVCRQVLHAHQ